MNNNNSELTVYISNMSEDVWPFIQSMSNPYIRQTEIIENAGLAEHDLLSFTDRNNILMVMPKPVGRFYQNYFQEISKNRNLQIIAPGQHTGEISKDIISDKQFFEELISIVSKYNNIDLISYCCSAQFLNLASEMKKRGINMETPEAPSEADSWLVDFYGSKSGIRQLSQQSEVKEPDFKMPPGLISVDIENTAKIAAKMYIKEKSLVIKTNKGHAGAGLYILRENDLPFTYQDCVNEILKLFQKEHYWNRFPIIIEKYIEPAITIGGGYPNIEFKIQRNGKVDFLYYCALRVTRTGIFNGVEISNTVLSDKDTAQIMDTGFYLGEQLSSRGYRGYYEVDFVASKNGDIFVTETNIRRTGGTHVYHLAKVLFGKDFLYETYILTHNAYPITKKQNINEPEKLFEKLSSILFDKNKKEGVVITGTRLLENNYFGYIIFGNSKSRAIKIEEQMIKLLG